MKAMKRILACLLLLCLTLSAALAETTINPQEKRKIKLTKVGDNEAVDGISPTTGLELDSLDVPEGAAGLAATGRYMPVLVQIGNDEGGIGYRAPWGLSYADIIYETPLVRSHVTRLTAVFSDIIPDSVGYVRSARIGHIWLREEWNGALIYYGQQESDGSNVKAEISKLKAGSMTFSGIGSSTPYRKYFTRVNGLKSPYNVDVNAAAIAEMVPEDEVAVNHTYKFTDESPEEGDSGNRIAISWGSSSAVYNSVLLYSEKYSGYLRYLGNEVIADNLYIDKNTSAPIVFQNVIIQFTDVNYNHNNKNEPLMYVIGKNGASAEGNADFFMCGQHVAGYWKRDSMTSRTVYYDANGEELSLQRGHTLIVIFPDDAADARSVVYE